MKGNLPKRIYSLAPGMCLLAASQPRAGLVSEQVSNNLNYIFHMF